MDGDHAASSRDGTSNVVVSRDFGSNVGLGRVSEFCRSAFTQNRVHMGFWRTPLVHDSFGSNFLGYNHSGLFAKVEDDDRLFDCFSVEFHIAWAFST